MQASDGNAGFGMNKREAVITSFHRHGTGVEIKGFDKMDNVVISHDDIVPDRRVVVLVWPRTRADSKCRGLIAQSIEDKSWRFDSTSMDGSPRCKVFFGTKGNIWLTRGRADRFDVRHGPPRELRRKGDFPGCFSKLRRPPPC